jgi:uncharacterized protein
MSGLCFEWDSEKARENLNKHGISFEEAATIFGDPIAITIDDLDHSTAMEDRFVTIGSTRRHLIVVVCHTDRHGTIRLISARKANRQERDQYYA